MLPHSLQEIADVIGTKAAIQLSIALGGQDAEQIPQKMTKDHKIAKIIGFEAAQKLAEWVDGGRINIPRAVGHHKGKRNEEILQAVAEGKSKRSLALKYQLTERHLRNITNRNSEDPDQGNLF